MKHRFAIKFAYLGQNYQGFQRQKKGIKTIEGTILEVLQKQNILEKTQPARYSAAGRTDRGVNALGQVIAFDSPREQIYLEELNANLPDDIFAWGLATVPSTFNARRDATLRIYKYYTLYNGEDLELIAQALTKLEGTHDFKKLSKKADPLPSGIQKSTVLTLECATVVYHKMQNLLEFEFSSRSFLWHQVRKMVSLVLAIGQGLQTLEGLDDVLNPEKPELPGGIKLAPPEGLILYDVHYPNVVFQGTTKKSLIEVPLKRKLATYSALQAVLQLMKNHLI